jgi:hypothetical protein
MNDLDHRAPALSVILATAGGFPSIRTTLRHLQQQTVADRLEVIILAPETNGFGLPPAGATSFHDLKLVRLGTVLPVALVNAEGVRHASAPLVVFAEDHAFPERDWAEALIARHAEDWAAVGPVVRNGNPGTATSWADFLLGYGPWREGREAGQVTMLAGHNCSYKREVLLGQGEKLRQFLTAESVLHEALVKNGQRLFLENRAVISHLSFARPGALLAVQYYHGRQYGACRSRDWPMWKRSIYFLAAPMIPFVRLARILARGINLPRRVSRLRFFAILLANLVSDAIGQAAGYLCGAGSSGEFLTCCEYNRHQFITPADAQEIDLL